MEYYIGLDIGSNSVGWSCVDSNYNLCKFRRKHMWGSRLITETQTAAERRTYRSTRRLLTRRKERCNLLRQFFEPEIIKFDPEFFNRLEYSFLIPDEKSKEQFGKTNVNIIFDDANYSDKNHYEKYPTIYHLRSQMIHSDEKFDLREIYLLLHHMVKYRGNFLYEGGLESFTKSLNLSDNLKAFLNYEYTNEELDNVKILNLQDNEIEKMVSILNDNAIPKYLSPNKRNNTNLLTKEEAIFEMLKNDCSNQLGKAETKKISNIIKAIIGYNFNLAEILNIDVNKENKNDLKFKFDSTYDDKKYQIYDLLDDENIVALELLESCYTSFFFKDIMQDVEFLCDAKVKTYNQHKEDLQLLKTYIKNVCKIVGSNDLYNVIFRKVINYKNADTMARVGCSYSMYVKNQQNIKHKGQLYSGCTKELFYTLIKNIISIHLDNNKDYVELLKDNLNVDLELLSGFKDGTLLNIATIINERIDDNTFLNKLNDVSNALLPYQLNYKEMDIILKKQSKYYDFLKDDSDKIKSILTFRRPYYVGVLNSKSKFSWAKDDNGQPLISDERIYPWNFNEKINKKEFEKRFIEALSGKCMYFRDEFVLAKRTIRYQAYCVLNELNKIRISLDNHNYKFVNSDLKQYLFKNLFLKYSKVTVEKLIAALKDYDKDLYSNLTAKSIKGIAKLDQKGLEAEFNNSMSTYVTFKKIFGANFDIKNIDVYDEIVRILAIFKDKDVLKEMLRDIKGITITDKHIKSLMALKITGWGKFSKKFLDEIIDNTGRTILEDLYYAKKDDRHQKDICYNLEELINDKLLGFKGQLFKTGANEKYLYNFNRDIKGLYCSPNEKTVIWQAICIVEEIVKIKGEPPKNIFIESTKDPSVKLQLKNRCDYLINLYKGISKNKEYEDVYKELKSYSDKYNVMSDKLYLYFTQLGRCMYSHNRLSISNLSEYDVDHIIPRCIIKDDSIANKVLVMRSENQRKSGDFVLNNAIVSKNKEFWEYLKNNNLISNRKYESLIKTEYNARELHGFINRQVVEANQIVKELSNLLSLKYEKGTIFGINASIITQFRENQMLNNKPGFAKIRSLNDMHHAKDAYLAATIGHFYKSLICDNNDDKDSVFEWINRDLKNKAKSTKDLNELINKRNGYILNALEYDTGNNSELIDYETGELLNQKFLNILTNMAYNDCLVTKKVTKVDIGCLYNETRYGRKAKQSKLIPLRYVKNLNNESIPLDTSRYGGYSCERSANCMIIKLTNSKAQIEYKLVNLSLMDYFMNQNNKNYIINKLNNQFDNKYSKIEIVKQNIPKNQLALVDGQWVYIMSDKELNNAVQLVLDKEYDKLLYFISKYNFVGKDRNIDDIKDDLLRNAYNELKNNGTIIDDLIVHYIEKINKTMKIYTIGDDKKTTRVKLKNYDWDQKCNIVKELMKATRCDGSRTDALKDIVGRISYGRIRNIKINPEKTIFKYNSVTGLYAWEINPT